MKNSTLIIRSVLVIALLASSAHFITFSSQNKINKNENNETPKSKEATKIYNLEGNWKVQYNTKEFKGAIIYNIIKKDEKYAAYIVEYQDKDGYSKKSKKEKMVSFSKIQQNKVKGIYKMMYEGKQYDVDCIITFIDDKTFQLSYDYYGYSDVETWKRI